MALSADVLIRRLSRTEADVTQLVRDTRGITNTKQCEVQLSQFRKQCCGLSDLWQGQVLYNAG